MAQEQTTSPQRALNPLATPLTPPAPPQLQQGETPAAYQQMDGQAVYRGLTGGGQCLPG